MQIAGTVALVTGASRPRAIRAGPRPGARMMIGISNARRAGTCCRTRYQSALELRREVAYPRRDFPEGLQSEGH